MNTPNKLTILRVILVPLYLILLYCFYPPTSYYWALFVFIVASLTDLLDGYLARKRNQVTTFGKFLDPLADKILVMSAFVYFIGVGLASSAAVIIMIAREFMVTSLRLVAVSSNGKVIAAGSLGKVKTASQMIAIVAILLLAAFDSIHLLPVGTDVRLISNLLVWICTLLTVVSGVQYMVKNWSCIREMK